MTKTTDDETPNFQFAPASTKTAALTEREIFSCLAENFKLAAENCQKLADQPQQGPTYRAFRDQLKLIEGAARQAAFWREDARWLQIGLQMEEAHKRAGDWIRKKHPRWRFRKLAEVLRAGERAAINLRDKKTNRIGMILPNTSRGPVRTAGRAILVPEMPQPRKFIMPSSMN